MSKVEYAKLLTWYTPYTVYGVRTNVKLPREVSIGGAKGNGFLDAYLSVDGPYGNHYECGLSIDVNQANREEKWHWMWTAAGFGSDGGEYIYTPGSVVPIELSVNPSTDKMEFKVDNQVIKEFVGDSYFAEGIKRAHLVIGSCDQNFLHASDVPDPLPDWNTFHDAIICDNFSYRDAAGYWHICDSGNTRLPSTNDEIHWPRPSYEHPHQGSPFHFDMSVSAGRLSAALPRP